ncbi:MAG: hypothetical protein GDA55_00145 [Cellvibrionales bacterium]|nr:hypothetical protein [Cellvibrionales bacterium]
MPSLAAASRTLRQQAARLNVAATRRAATGLLLTLALLALGLALTTALAPQPVIRATVQATAPPSPPRWNWFPTQEAAAEPEPVEITDSSELPLAKIKAELLGVLIAPEGSFAAISTGRNPNGVYGPGDEIQRTVSLQDVHADHVVVDESGRRGRIPIKGLAPGTKKTDLLKVQPSTPTADGPTSFNLPRLVTSPTFVPIAGGGAGLKLSGLSDQLRSMAEVQEGDVVTAVNGLAIRQIMTNNALQRELSQQTSLPITLLRAGQELEIIVNAASLMQNVAGSTR